MKSATPWPLPIVTSWPERPPLLTAIRPYIWTWTALVVASVALDMAIVATYFHLPTRSAEALKLSFPVQFKNWTLWALLAPGIIAFVRTMMVRRWSWARRASYTAALGVALALTHVAMEMVSMGLHVAGGGHPRAEPMGFFSYHLWHGLLTSAVLLTVAVLIESERASKERELREAQLQDQVSRAQLQMLRMQLQPHFLFNTLNSISALVDDDARAGQRMIGRLSEFLRLTLSHAGHRDIRLGDELALACTYLELEKTRFADRLRVEVEVDRGAEEALVPNLVLQPLVENAIGHGIQPSLTGGTVTIRARRDEDDREGDHWLVIEVLDDGIGLPADFAVGTASGIGLSNTRARLRERFRDRHRFLVERRTPSGTRVSIRLPWSTSAAGTSTRGHADAAPVIPPVSDSSSRPGAGALA